MLSPLSSAKQGNFQLESSPALQALIIAFSAKLSPVSLGECFVNCDNGRNVTPNGSKIALNSVNLFSLCVANIILIFRLLLLFVEY